MAVADFLSPAIIAAGPLLAEPILFTRAPTSTRGAVLESTIELLRTTIACDAGAKARS
jgi:hypothetical protein